MSSDDDLSASRVPTVGSSARSGWDSAAEEFARLYMLDRRSERRWRVFFRLAWLVVFAVLAWALIVDRLHATAPSGPHTALVEVRGEIDAEGEASAELLVGALKNAFEDAGAQAVVLRINSPGGSPVQAGIIYDEIKRLKALHNKKVYAVVEEVCASGAYYIAAAADDIYTDKASVVGSIGVLMDSFGFTGAMEKYGVERRLLTAGANKGIGDPFSPLTDKQRAYLQSTLDQIHQQFIAVVKEGRGDRLKVTPDTFSGLFWNGEEAIKLGLADHLGNLDYVAREVVQAEDIIDYTPKENVAERLAKRFGASIGAGAIHALNSMGRIR
ncbi:MAG: S49 family peptidase [Burkholderiaceae bacterium]|nr:S49 family peptidase [Burkholderiaceae bacterium]